MKELAKKLREYGVSMAFDYGVVTFTKDGFGGLYALDDTVIEKSTTSEMQNILINLLETFMYNHRVRREPF